MKKFTYSLLSPKRFISSYKKERHIVFKLEKHTHLVPEKLNRLCLNPETILNLTKHLSIKKILIFDKVQNIKKEFSIVDHVNRSGTNFLIGNTPHKNRAQFPDMSKIYEPIKGLDKIVVHTVGEKRFSNFKSSDYNVSESIGLIAPLWHYVGVRVFSKTYKKEAIK